MAAHSHVSHHLRTDVLVGTLVVGAMVLAAGTTILFLDAQRGGAVGRAQDEGTSRQAVAAPMLMIATSVERARAAAAPHESMSLIATSVERARAAAAPHESMSLIATSVERARAADARQMPGRRGGP